MSEEVDWGSITDELALLDDFMKYSYLCTKVVEDLHRVNRNLARACGAGHSRDILWVQAAFVVWSLARQFCSRRGLKCLPNYRRLEVAEARRAAAPRHAHQSVRGGNPRWWWLAERRKKWREAGLDFGGALGSAERDVLEERWLAEYKAMSVNQLLAIWRAWRQAKAAHHAHSKSNWICKGRRGSVFF